jgi:hypothetical protein
VTGQLLADRSAIRREFEEAQETFHVLFASASEEALDHPSNGTRWTNRQLLFHMMLGYLVVDALLPLVKAFNRLPAPVGRVFARLLNGATGLFNAINYWGSVVGSRLYRGQRMVPKFDAVIAALQQRLDRESPANLGRSTAYPVPWDPFFSVTMTLEDGTTTRPSTSSPPPAAHSGGRPRSVNVGRVTVISDGRGSSRPAA